MRTERERCERHPQPNPIPTAFDDEDSRSRHIMARLQDSLTSQLDPSVAVDSSVLERHLGEVFHSFHTPTHPPYALMIRTAISGLNEEGGSTAEAISESIKREFNDLPCAHGSVLGVHLWKLCEDGELARVEGGRYVLRDSVETTKQCRNKKRKKKKKKKISYRGGENEREEEEEEEEEKLHIQHRVMP